MARNHIISAIFLTLVSANIIQGGVIVPGGLFHEQAFPNLVNLVGMHKIGDLSHDFATSAASAASSAFNGFKTYIDNFRTGLGQHINIPPKYAALHRFVHGEIWPSFAGPATGVVPGHIALPGLAGNYGGVSDGAASAGVASSTASGRAAKR